MNYRKIALSSCALSVAFAGQIASAQDGINVPELNRLSKVFTQKYKADMQRAQTLLSTGKYSYAAILPNGKVQVLQGMRNGKPMFYQTYNLDAARSISANEVWPGGKTGFNLTGASVTFRIWDGGTVQTSHPEYTGRATNMENSGVSDHAMHVTGTVMAAGIDAQAKGMSFGALSKNYDFGNDGGEMASEASNADTILSNHSYGPSYGWLFGARGDNKWVWLGDPAISTTKDFEVGRYNAEVKFFDDMLFASPYYLPVAAAGNSENGGPTNQPVDHWVFTNGAWASSQDVRDDQSSFDNLISSLGIAKNTVTVGACLKLQGPYFGPASVRIADFSSWGPTDDGRVKPDVVAPGVDLYSSVPGGYAEFSGTSMASPTVCGGLGLLQDQYIQLHGQPMRSSMMRALVAQTAREAGANPGPDYTFGWGLLNVEAAANQIALGNENPLTMQDITFNGTDVLIPITVTNAQPLKVTIAWTDRGGVVQGNVNDDRTSRLVNDIDLEIHEVSSGNDFFPWKLDPNNGALAATTGDNDVDNIKQVVVNAPVNGQYIIKLKADGPITGGSQVVSVIIDGDLPTGVSGLDLAPANPVGGVQNSTGSVNLVEVQTTDTVVDLVSSNPSAASVPSSVTVQAGTLSAEFPITTYNVRPSPLIGYVPVQITATSDIGGRSAQLRVRPVGIAGIAFDSSEIAGGTSVGGTVTLNSAAPAGGLAVALTSSTPRVAKPARNWVYIPAGRVSANFTTRTFGVAADENVSITATRLGSSFAQTLKVKAANLVDFTATPGTLTTGLVKFRVTLDAAAGSSGATVLLSSNDPGAITVPASVQVKSGAKYVDFGVAVARQASPRTVIVKATRGSIVKTVTVNLN